MPLAPLPPCQIVLGHGVPTTRVQSDKVGDPLLQHRWQVPCGLEGCSTADTASKVAEHKDECFHRPWKCPSCDKHLIKTELWKHIQEKHEEAVYPVVGNSAVFTLCLVDEDKSGSNKQQSWSDMYCRTLDCRVYVVSGTMGGVKKKNWDESED